jgi:hypothetical protein
MNIPRSNKQTRRNTLDKDREDRKEAIPEPGGVKDARSSPPIGPEMERLLGLSSLIGASLAFHSTG